MQTISVQTTQNVSIQHQVASVGDRILAHILDRVILVVYYVVVITIFINLELEVVWLWLVMIGFPLFFYFLVFEIFMNGQSPGKRVMSIQVVRLNGAQATIGDYMMRWVLSLLEFFVLLGAIPVVVAAVNGRGQRLGDIVAGTFVIKLVAVKNINAQEVFITAEDAYTPVFPQVVKLQSRDIELIQRALDANRNFGNAQPSIMVCEKIKTLLGVQSDLPPTQFLYTIVKDFNHLNAQ